MRDPDEVKLLVTLTARKSGQGAKQSLQGRLEGGSVSRWTLASGSHIREALNPIRRSRTRLVSRKVVVQ